MSARLVLLKVYKDHPNAWNNVLLQMEGYKSMFAAQGPEAGEPAFPKRHLAQGLPYIYVDTEHCPVFCTFPPENHLSLGAGFSGIHSPFVCKF